MQSGRLVEMRVSIVDWATDLLLLQVYVAYVLQQAGDGSGGSGCGK